MNPVKSGKPNTMLSGAKVIKTESQLKGFEDTLKLVNVAIKNSADNTIDWGDKFQKFGGKLEKVGST